MSSNICGNCKFAGVQLKNQWQKTPSLTCGNPFSFRGKNGQRVTKGMTCSKFESEKEQEAA